MALFRTHGLQKDDMVILSLWCFIKVRFRKMQFLKDGVQTVAFVLPQDNSVRGKCGLAIFPDICSLTNP